MRAVCRWGRAVPLSSLGTAAPEGCGGHCICQLHPEAPCCWRVLLMAHPGREVRGGSQHRCRGLPVAKRVSHVEESELKRLGGV